jgi:large subunit ribosomal protein L5
MSRLYDRYKKDVVPELQKDLGITNIMAVPRLDKIIVNVGVGDAIQNSKLLDTAKAELALITGQLPGIGRAKNRFRHSS